MKINEQWEELKEETHANIQSEKGILNARFVQSRRKAILETLRKTRTSGGSIIGAQKKHTKNSCCMR